MADQVQASATGTEGGVPDSEDSHEKQNSVKQLGRFLVTEEGDSSSSPPSTAPPPHPPPNVEKKGRFVVRTELDEDESDVVLKDPNELNRVSMSSITSLATSYSEASLPVMANASFISPGDAYQSLPASSLIPPYQAAVLFNDSNQPSSALAQGLEISPSVLSSSPASPPSLQDTERDRDKERERGTVTNRQANAAKKTTPSAIMFELQKISAQNRKLHKMLLELSSSGPVPRESKDSEESGEKKKAQTTGETGSSAVAGILGSSDTMGDMHQQQQQAPRAEQKEQQPGKVAVPSVGSTVRLQELVSELNSNAINLITEYDALKMRNFVLTKQLKDVKQQLKEANLKIENLKQELGKAEVFQRNVSQQQSPTSDSESMPQ